MKTKVSVAVIGEGETEWFFIDSLRILRRFPFRVAPDFPSHADIGHIRKLLMQYLDAGYDFVVCLIDMDRINEIVAEKQRFHKIKSEFTTKKYANRVLFLETNPCTEFWFLLHFLPSPVIRHYHSQQELIRELQKYMPGYEKTKRYFIKANLQKYLEEHGNLDTAMKNAATLSKISVENHDDAMAYSHIHKLFDLLDHVNS